MEVNISVYYMYVDGERHMSAGLGHVKTHVLTLESRIFSIKRLVKHSEYSRLEDGRIRFGER